MNIKAVLFVFLLIFSSIILIHGATTSRSGEIATYKCYAQAFFYGYNPAYKDCKFIKTNLPSFKILPVEYPILSLLPMSFGLLLPLNYHSLYIYLMLLVIYSFAYFLIKNYSLSTATKFIILLVLGSYATALCRLDIILAFLLLYVFFKAKKRKFSSAYFFLGLATMYKIFPVIFLIPLFLWENHNSIKHFRGLLIYLSTCFSLIILSLIINPSEAFSPLSFALTRSLEIESFPATIIHLLSLAETIQSKAILSTGSIDISINNHQFLQLLTLGSLSAFIIVFFSLSLLFRYKKIDFQNYFLLTLLVFLSTNKVFSPQYLIWADPFIAVFFPFSSIFFYLWLLLCVLSTIIYPFLFSTITINQPLSQALILVIFLRNLLIGLFIFKYFLSSLKKKNHPKLPKKSAN